MPRTRSGNPFDTLIDALVDEVASRLSNGASGRRVTAGGGANLRRPSALKGRKRDMSCRFPGCRNRSKGPRFRYLCEEHLKLPKREQKAVLEKAKEARK